MFRKHATGVLVAACLGATTFAQAPSKIDFGRDVLPVLRQNCWACHGAQQQISGLRLDRRSSVFKAGMRRVVPGSSDNSFLYHRLTGAEYGIQMPPTGPLRKEQVELIKAWIDQGAEWPDALANEADRPPVNPKAAAMVEALRAGDRRSFLKFVAEDAKLLNARGPEGATPFMYAVLYGDTSLLEQLIKRGADVNAHNDANATALMWAATNLEKTRVLLAHGADVNARSDEVRTPLMIAAGHPGGTAIVKLLLERGADPNPTKNPMAESSPLVQAALAGDPESVQLLLDRGADVKTSGPMALMMAVSLECAKCADLLVKKDLGKMAYTFTLLNVAPFADAKTTKLLLDRGAEVNAVDPFGRTALMYAAMSDLLPAESVKVLIEGGADVNAKSQHTRSPDTGLTALDFAKMHGQTPVVDVLVKAGAKAAAATAAAPKPQPAASIRSAIERSLPLLLKADAGFTAKSGCISCHNNSLESMAGGLARKSGFRRDETIAAGQVKANIVYVENKRGALYQGYFAAQAGAEAFGDTFGPVVLGYVLVGLDGERYKADLNTDAVAMYLKSRQMADGRWAYPAADARQPLCSGYIGQTALAMRGLQLYAPNVQKAEYERAIQLAAAWLAQAEPKGFEDRLWRLQGLAWAGRDKDLIRQAARGVADLQRADGGWSDLPSMESNAYATGRALVALQAAGMPVADSVYRRGVQFLLSNQLGDGSWFVRTRSLALQPYFESGFPHGYDQWMSAAGTSWATMALSLAAPSASEQASAVLR